MKSTVRIIDHCLYPRSAVELASQAYKEYCAFDVVPVERDKAKITVSVKPVHIKREREIVLEFLNYMLDKSAEFYLKDQ